VQTFVEIGSAVRQIFPDKKNKKNKQIESLSRVAQLTLGARLTRNVTDKHFKNLKNSPVIRERSLNNDFLNILKFMSLPLNKT